jgi:hypothetical protein
MPSFRDRVIFRIDQEVEDILVARYTCKRRQVNSLSLSVPKLISDGGRRVRFKIYEGHIGPQQKRGMPIQWEFKKELVAGSDLQER